MSSHLSAVSGSSVECDEECPGGHCCGRSGLVFRHIVLVPGKRSSRVCLILLFHQRCHHELIGRLQASEPHPCMQWENEKAEWPRLFQHGGAIFTRGSGEQWRRKESPGNACRKTKRRLPKNEHKDMPRLYMVHHSTSSQKMAGGHIYGTPHKQPYS